jgi:hypothetical protein
LTPGPTSASSTPRPPFPRRKRLQAPRRRGAGALLRALNTESKRLIAAAHANGGVEQHATLVDRYGAGLAISVVHTLEERVLVLRIDQHREEVFRRMPVILSAFGFGEVPDGTVTRIGGSATGPSAKCCFCAS